MIIGYLDPWGNPSRSPTSPSPSTRPKTPATLDPKCSSRKLVFEGLTVGVGTYC